MSKRKCKNLVKKSIVSIMVVAMLFMFDIILPVSDSGSFILGGPIYTEAATVTYYKPCPKSCNSIVDGLKSIGVDSSYANRKQIASLNGYSNYTGTAAQNNNLLSLLKQGKLIKSVINTTSLRFPIRGSIAKSSSCKTNGQYCDYKAASGTPVYAPCNGTVQFRQSYATSYNKLCSYGNSIFFTSADGKTTVLCAHLSKFNNVTLKYTQSLAYPCSSSKYNTKTITLGTRTVKQGDLLGYTGKTGNASGPHIHIEVKINGTAKDPASVFQKW